MNFLTTTNNRGRGSFTVNTTIILMATICPHVGMNQFGQMGMQSMGQGSTPPLPLNPPGNQVGSCCHITDCFRFYHVKYVMSYNKFPFILFTFFRAKKT